MAIYRGPGGSGDATADSANTAQVAETFATQAGVSAAAAAGSAIDANAARVAAEAAQTAAELAETNAETAETNAETAETNAETAQAAAEAAQAAAEAAQTAAELAETNAETAETNAETAQAAAEAAQLAAENAQTAAELAETNAETAETGAVAAQLAAESARDSALAAYDNFDDRYLGAKTSDPALDNDGNALVAGALYFNSVAGEMRLYTGSAWVAAYVSGAGFVDLASAQTITGVKTFDNGLNTDTISEETSAAGVTVDGVLLKDNQVSTDQINEKTSAAGVTIDGVLLKDTTVTANTIKASGTSSTQGEVQLFEDTDNGTNYVAFKAPASISADVTWTLPNADGTADQVLKTNGSGALGWATAGGASNLGDGSATTPSVNFSADTNTGVYRPGNDRLGFATNGALVGEFDGTNLKFNSGYGSVATAFGCRAWVNFDGTGTPAIRASGNVSSITDNATGDYTVNFTTAMPDDDYITINSCRRDFSSGGAADVGYLYSEQPTTTATRIMTGRINDKFDEIEVNVVIFR